MRRAPAPRLPPRPARIRRCRAGRAGSAGCPPGPLRQGCACSWLANLSFDFHRNRKRERRTLADIRLNPNTAAVHPDDALGDRQAETSSAFPFGCNVIRLLELLEDLPLIRKRNARSGVTHSN